MKKISVVSGLLLSLSVFSQQGLTVDSEGKVGINTETPTESLEVKGRILTERITAEPNIPDGTEFIDNADELERTRVFNVGTHVGKNGAPDRILSLIDIPQNSTNPKSNVWFGLEDRNNSARFRVRYYTGGNCNFYLYDGNQSVGLRTEVDYNYSLLQMPKTDSQIVIGGTWSLSDLTNNNNKFIVKSGNAVIQGDLTANRLITPTQTFADYVFEDAYKLKPLVEVEDFILKNNRLEGFKSEKEIIEEGLDIKEITIKQQEKIEELTLYIIEMSKEIKALQKTVNNK